MIFDLFRLDGKTALVTGATRGIGLGITRAFLDAGAHVIMSSRVPKPDVVAELKQAGGKVDYLQADVRDPKQVQKLIADATAITGRLDILVNNAGATWGAPLDEFDDAAWDRVLDLNVKGVFHLTKFLRPALAAAGTHHDPARVVNIGSVDGIRVPSLETWASTISGRPITKRSASQGRMVLAMSVIASKSVTPRW